MSSQSQGQLYSSSVEDQRRQSVEVVISHFMLGGSSVLRNQVKEKATDLWVRTWTL